MPGSGETGGREAVSRGGAVLALAVLALVTLTLGLWELRYGLPAVLHSAFIQARQAADLLKDGEVPDLTVYPATLVLGYAAADLAAYGAGRALGWEGYADWDTFVLHLSRPAVHQAIGRAFGVFMAALLGLAVYRMARLRCSRGVSLLAAAIASLCPLQTLYAHQVRPHVPVITLIVLLAPPMLRLAEGCTPRRALLAGLAAGTVNGVFQVGMPMLATTFVLLAFFARPFGALVVQGLLASVAFVAAWQGIPWLLHASGLITEGVGTGLMAQTLDEGMRFGVVDMFDDLLRFPALWGQWFLTEPARAIALVAFLALCFAGRRSWRDALLYGAFPAVTLTAIALVMGARPRYAMYATPFLAVLAASAALAPRRAWLRVAAAVVLVAAPLVSSVRIDQLLARGDTRLSLAAAMPGLSEAGLRVAVQADVMPTGAPLPAGTRLFPPRGNYMRWHRKEETPRQTLDRIAPDVFVRNKRAGNPLDLKPVALTRAGFVKLGVVGEEPGFQPDEPGNLWPDLWRADRPGPEVEVWALRDKVGAAVAALPDGLVAR